mgnify:CR=1 FL=1
MRNLRSALIACILFVSPAFAIDALECGHRHAAAAADGRSFDPATGRDVHNYPPDPQVRFEHLQLELRFNDLASRSFEGVETLRFQTLQRPLDRLKLDAVDLRIQQVTTADDAPLTYTYDDRRLTVYFDPPLPPGTSQSLRIRYRCVDPPVGMFWALRDAAYPDRPEVVHTQGQAEDNRYWFISHDYPNARFSSEMIVTVPERYVAVSNGRLVDKAPAGEGFTRYHYLQEQPHVSYLVSLVVGELVCVRDTWRGRPVEYWVPAGREEDARRTFGRTPEMMDLFSRLTGIDYPYDKYAQLVCPLLRPGGMENTTATTMHEDILLTERAALDQDEESLIAHELAHQWFGDMVTCRSWAHLWLNESFASFLADVWYEYGRGEDEYAYEVWRTMERVIADTPTGGGPGIVYAAYETPGEQFSRRGSNPYTKGACFLHMLRVSLGDKLFWRAVHELLDTYAWQSIETDDFRKIIDRLSGRSHDQFFQQWLYRGGVPKLRTNYTWDAARRRARVTLEQTQELTRETPAYATDTEIWSVLPDGTIGRHPVRLEGRSVIVAFELPEEPAQIVVDPLGGVLAPEETTLPVRMLARQALGGPTMFARLRAVAALAERNVPDAYDTLGRLLRDESTFWGLRAAAARSLGKMRSPAARDILLGVLAEGNVIQHPKARAAAVAALGEYRGEAVRQTLLRFAREDASEVVEARTTQALGNQPISDELVRVLLENRRKPSHSNWIQREVAAAFSALRDPRGLDAVLELAAYGRPERARPTAIGALAPFVEDPEHGHRVRQFLIDLLDDPQMRARTAAIDALASAGDRRSIPALRRIAESARPAGERARATAAIARITKENGPAAQWKELQERIDRLEKAREAADERLAKLEAAASATASAPSP